MLSWQENPTHSIVWWNAQHAKSAQQNPMPQILTAFQSAACLVPLANQDTESSNEGEGADPAHKLLTSTQLKALWAATLQAGSVRAVQAQQ